jgi:hypothetical protein
MAAQTYGVPVEKMTPELHDELRIKEAEVRAADMAKVRTQNLRQFKRWLRTQPRSSL